MIRDLALLAARLAVGQGMASHGAQKALGWFEGPGPEGAGAMMEGLGFRPGTGYARFAAWNEIVAGGLMSLGLGGPIGPALLISTMIVAQVTVHGKNGFFAQKGGIELGVVYSAAALTFAVTDYGALSADRALGLDEPLHHPIFTTLVLIGAVAGAYLVLGTRSSTPPAEPATPTYRGKNSPLHNGSTAPTEHASA
jgi:putative oxidoreductase